MFGKKKEAKSADASPAVGSASSWRRIDNPEGDPADVVAYGAAVAEGRIAGKYQLSTIKVPKTVIIQRSRVPGIIAGADVTVDRDAAHEQGIEVVRTSRQGRNSARVVGTINLSELTSRASRDFTAVDVDPDEPAALIYTSGTTGDPKGVTLTHRNFHFQLNTVVKSLVPFSSADRVMGVLPMYHIFGLANSMVAAINYGACVVMLPQYSPANLLSAIKEHEVTILPAVPSMYQHLLAVARARKAEIPKSLRNCISGGAALPLAILRSFSDTFGAQILEGYGLTETTSSVCANGQGGVFKEGSIGPPAEGVEMQTLDDDGNPVADGEVGEIAIRSDTVFVGYWKNEAATAEVKTSDGWFRTGDLGYRDSDGYYYITDRKKDIIITGGYNVSPREIEEVLMAHPKIADAAVVGMDGRANRPETITAFIVAHENETIEERDIVHHCELELAAYKRPKVINIVAALPKSATGKVLRSELRGERADRRLVEKD